MRTLLALSTAIAVCATPALATADTVYGAFIPNETRKVGEGRYRATRDWDRTLRSLASVYYRKKGVVWRPMKTSPGVRGVHIQNIRPNQQWEGINVYETRGKVFLYVLRNPDYVPKKKKGRRRRK